VTGINAVIPGAQSMQIRSMSCHFFPRANGVRLKNMSIDLIEQLLTRDRDRRVKNGSLPCPIAGAY
jgi:hypothetical protein